MAPEPESIMSSRWPYELLPYRWHWNRLGRKGQRCRVVARGRMNSALLEFEDGFRVVTSRSGLRRV
jgi:hypothetical protein